MNVESLEKHLAELRAAVQKLLERQEAPRVMRYEKAARLLDCSVSKVRLLVRAGDLVPVRIGGRKMIPLSEIERISTPRLPKALAAKAPPKKRDGKADAAAFRAMLKKR
jgi:hypothetical protein